MNKPRVVSLFSGVGGLDLGFLEAGFDVIWANDFNKDCFETYRENIGKHVIFGDIDGIDLENVPQSDVIIGGPPCQGFSVAGKMDPDDPRSKMLWSFVGVVKRLKPKVFVMENVKALGNLDKWALVRSELLTRFNEIGYKVQYSILNAADYGVPQSRERVFFVGTRMPDLDISFPQPTHAGGWVSARAGLNKMPEPGQLGNEGECNAKIVLSPYPVMRKSPFAGMLFNGQGRLIDLDRPSPTLHASMGGNKTPIIDLHQLKCNTEPWIVGYHRSLEQGGRPANCEVPDYLRRLTMREAARLQTFPDSFTFHGKLSSQFRQIGNAVPPRLAYCVANEVLQILDSTNCRDSQRMGVFQVPMVGV